MDVEKFDDLSIICVLLWKDDGRQNDRKIRSVVFGVEFAHREIVYVWFILHNKSDFYNSKSIQHFASPYACFLSHKRFFDSNLRVSRKYKIRFRITLFRMKYVDIADECFLIGS